MTTKTHYSLKDRIIVGANKGLFVALPLIMISVLREIADLSFGLALVITTPCFLVWLVIACAHSEKCYKKYGH